MRALELGIDSRRQRHHQLQWTQLRPSLWAPWKRQGRPWWSASEPQTASPTTMRTTFLSCMDDSKEEMQDHASRQSTCFKWLFKQPRRLQRRQSARDQECWWPPSQKMWWSKLCHVTGSDNDKWWLIATRRVCQATTNQILVASLKQSTIARQPHRWHDNHVICRIARSYNNGNNSWSQRAHEIA